MAHQCLHAAALLDVLAAKKARIQAVWEQHKAAARFVSDFFKEEWERIQPCRTTFRIYQSKQHPDCWRATPKACWRIPFCIPCTQADVNMRAVKAMDNFHRVTPGGKKPLFFHIILTAPITDDMEGWGVKASEDIAKFAGWGRKVLTELFGDGIGGIMSYQDFGERPFSKRHPHLDLTLNGHAYPNAEVKVVRQLDFRHGGKAAIDVVTAKYAQAFQLGAKPSNANFHGPWEGVASYHKVLRYQLREMIDLRKMEYDGKTVWWRSYRDESRDSADPYKVLGWLSSYRRRLGQFAEGDNMPRQELHRYYGHMSKNKLGQAQKLIHGVPMKHGRDCVCAKCHPWERIYGEGGPTDAPI